MHRVFALKNPMVNRFMWSIVVMTSYLQPLWAQAPNPMTVEQLVVHALSEPTLEAEHEAMTKEERATMAHQLMRPLPTFGIDQEYVFGSTQVAYDQVTASVSQGVDFSDWRTRMHESYSSRQAALDTVHELWRFEIAMDVRAAAYEALYRQERLLLMDDRISQLARAMGDLDARAKVGDVSRYEVLRLERGLVHARAQRSRENVLLKETLGQLAMWVPEVPLEQLKGDLKPSSAYVESSGTPLSIRRLDSLELALAQEYEAWGNPFLRGWILGAGYRFARVGGDSGHGFMLSVTIPLVVRDSDQPQQDILDARRAKVQAERTLLRRQNQAQQQAARSRLNQALAGLEVLARTSDDHLDVLTLATTSYRAGEISVDDLLNTYQTETELELLRVDMAWEARRADLDLRRALGLGEAP